MNLLLTPPGRKPALYAPNALYPEETNDPIHIRGSGIVESRVLNAIVAGVGRRETMI